MTEFVKPRIVQHVAGFDKIGGPSIQLQRLLNSKIADEFQFLVVSQDRPARGLNFSLISEMASKIKNTRPDIVHVRGLQNEGFHGAMAAYMAGCRNIIVSVHGFAENSSSRGVTQKRILSSIFEPITLLMAKKVYCVCHYGFQKEIVQKYAHNKSSVIYNGIDTSIKPDVNSCTTTRQKFGASNKDTIALYVGRISRDKGLFVLADALKQMNNPPILWIVGDGPDRKDLQVALGSLIEKGHAKFLGRWENVFDLLSACNFFVLPTFFENMSNAILEAMLSEKAIITTNVGGNPELVTHGKTGLLTPAGDADILAQNISLLSSKPELCVSMGKLGRHRVEQNFSLDQTIHKLIDLYRSML